MNQPIKALLNIIIFEYAKLKAVSADDIRWIALDLERDGVIDVTTMDKISLHRETLADCYNHFVEDYQSGDEDRISAYLQ